MSSSKETCNSCGRLLPILTEEVIEQLYAEQRLKGRSRSVIREIIDEGYVSWGVDPFADEIYDDQTEIWLCGRCAYESYMEI